jgi:hypothetical protein
VLQWGTMKRNARDHEWGGRRSRAARTGGGLVLGVM